MREWTPGRVIADWQPIDTAPKDGTAVLVLIKRPIVHWVAAICAEKILLVVTIAQWWPATKENQSFAHWISASIEQPDRYDPGYYQSYQRIEPTHWMPLPDPPHAD